MSSAMSSSSSSASSFPAQLFNAQQGHSIYEGTRMSGEQVRRHILPIDVIAESSGHSNDDDEDELYARSLLSLLSSPDSSRL
ncbi:hypothetical protein P43SY_006771 [Pythium insidiosum]|uniref:Uncharacterized protein n=1 Tax=Pythium insidiosum TaxID=114742 RepID=A0AAD5QAQ7_PYTIN|nr:hypothetical protein P43SY_006771 [Pythium insidiosum]